MFYLKKKKKIIFNSLHSQILEILIRMPSVGVQLLDITDLLHSTEWILKDLESKCNKYSCFAIAAAYIDILQRLHNLNRNT